MKCARRDSNAGSSARQADAFATKLRAHRANEGTRTLTARFGGPACDHYTTFAKSSSGPTRTGNHSVNSRPHYHCATEEYRRARDRDRTCVILITNQALYWLSYTGTRTQAPAFRDLSASVIGRFASIRFRPFVDESNPTHSLSSRRSDLNRQPALYESAAQPSCYDGIHFELRADGGTRTRDVLVGNEVLYH